MKNIGKMDKIRNKQGKHGKHKHFMSYDSKSSNLKYYDFASQNLMDSSMDRGHKRKKMV